MFNILVKIIWSIYIYVPHRKELQFWLSVDKFGVSQILYNWCWEVFCTDWFLAPIQLSSTIPHFLCQAASQDLSIPPNLLDLWDTIQCYASGTAGSSRTISRTYTYRGHLAITYPCTKELGTTELYLLKIQTKYFPNGGKRPGQVEKVVLTYTLSYVKQIASWKLLYNTGSLVWHSVMT